MRVVKGIVHQPFEVKGSSIFYAFSYYFDRAVESGLIGEWDYIRDKSQCYGMSTNASFLKNYAEQTCIVLIFQMDLVVVLWKSGISKREPKKVRLWTFSQSPKNTWVKVLPHTLHKHKPLVLICIWGSRQSHWLHKMIALPPHKHRLRLSHTNTFACVCSPSFVTLQPAISAFPCPLSRGLCYEFFYRMWRIRQFETWNWFMKYGSLGRLCQMVNVRREDLSLGGMSWHLM